MRKLTLAKVDYENGCEECWAELRRLHPDVDDLEDEDYYPAEFVNMRCSHGGYEFAPYILISSTTKGSDAK